MESKLFCSGDMRIYRNVLWYAIAFNTDESTSVDVSRKERAAIQAKSLLLELTDQQCYVDDRGRGLPAKCR